MTITETKTVTSVTALVWLENNYDRVWSCSSVSNRQWLPWVKMERRVIEIEFDGEVGERTGSWKGGTVGCSYEMQEDETIEQCLRRMEREREFN